ncbi:DUF86 domain-containing protein [candidate division KSB1 bacterium]|nr:DUF86 domain-containing protein [candidate division KSB1 bacterium]
MAPQILKQKIENLLEYLEALDKFKNISYEKFRDEHHFAIERLIELLVVAGTDLLMHKMSLEGHSLPTTYRTVFLRAGELQWLPTDLSEKLADSAGMRNILAHGYDRLDLKIIYGSVNQFLED